MLIQFLYIIRDMASSSDERNQKNARILQANIFYNDLCIISQYSFKLFDYKKHHISFLQDIIEFNHIMLEMLDEYSKGKVLTINTQKKRKAKKQKKKKKTTTQDQDGNEIQEFAEELEYSGDEFEEDQEETVERTFNFVSELAQLVDYDVISKYIFVVKNKSAHESKPLMIKAVTTFFRRIIAQTKQTWIFFQIETLSVMNEFVQKDISNNSLMTGILSKKARTQNQKQLEVYSTEMKQVIVQVTAKFTELLKTNKMLGVEILFRFPTRSIKDDILNNYSAAVQSGGNGKTPYEKPIDEAMIDMTAFGGDDNE